MIKNIPNTQSCEFAPRCRCHHIVVMVIKNQ